jgi:hypothetical protein
MEKWDGRERWRQWQYTRSTRVSKVEVDPERILLLDVNYSNNSWTARPRASAAATRWSLRWLTWLEDVLITWSCLS